MIARIALLAVLAGVFTPAMAPAQDEQTAVAQCLAFEEALNLGAQLAPEVQTAEARLAEGEADLAQARALFRPQLSSFVRTGIGDSGLTDSQIENQIGLRGTQRIFDFGDARFARQSARATVAARQFEIAAAEAAAGEKVGQSYLGWLETRDRLEATRQREAYFERQLASTESLLGQGGATVADRADINAEFLDAQSARTELQFLLERFSTRLAISTKRSGDPCAQDDVAKTLNRLLSTMADEDIVAASLAASPRVASLQADADSLSADASREARSRFPVISVTGISSYAVDDFDTRGAFRNRVGIDVSIPLYSGRAQTARIDGARARAAEAVGRLGEFRRQLEEDVRIAIRRIAALETQTARRSSAALSRAEQLAAAEAQFERGLRTLPDLIEVRLQFEVAELARIETIYELFREQLKLLSLSGNVVRDIE